jgi:GTP-binding protein
MKRDENKPKMKTDENKPKRRQMKTRDTRFVLQNAFEAQFLTGAASPGQFPAPQSFEIAFMGRSNCGKSSALNRFLGRKSLARVSSLPGRTREINFFRASWLKGSESFLVADLPGYGYAKVPGKTAENWKYLAESYLSQKRGQRAALLADCRRSLAEEELSLLKTLEELMIPAVLVLTKADKLSRSEGALKLRTLQKRLGDGVPVLLFSSLTGGGKEELLSALFPRSFLEETFSIKPGEEPPWA